MNKLLTEKMHGLIVTYLKAKQSGELDEEIDFCARMENNRTWLRDNILNLEKLKNYADDEYAKKFGEMFDYTDGSASANGLARGMHFSTNEKRLAVRTQFENLIGYITNQDNDRFAMLEEALNPNSPYKVPGLGRHMVSALINAAYPEVPSINNTTEDFFRNIGEPLPTGLSNQQRTVGNFFAEMKDLDNELTLDDVDHICWYSKTIPSGREYMQSNFPGTFNSEDAPRHRTGRRAKKLTPEEQLAARIAELQAIQNQAK